jgi:hypothetical protein
VTGVVYDDLIIVIPGAAALALIALASYWVKKKKR